MNYCDCELKFEKPQGFREVLLYTEDSNTVMVKFREGTNTNRACTYLGVCRVDLIPVATQWLENRSVRVLQDYCAFNDTPVTRTALDNAQVEWWNLQAEFQSYMMGVTV